MENKTKLIGNVVKDNKSREEFIDKKVMSKQIFSITHSSKMDNVLTTIDKYDYEANCAGSKIFDYDKFERHRNIQIMLMIGILGLYFVIGIIVGIGVTLS